MARKPTTTAFLSFAQSTYADVRFSEVQGASTLAVAHLVADWKAPTRTTRQLSVAARNGVFSIETSDAVMTRVLVQHGALSCMPLALPARATEGAIMAFARSVLNEAGIGNFVKRSGATCVGATALSVGGQAVVVDLTYADGLTLVSLKCAVEAAMCHESELTTDALLAALPPAVRDALPHLYQTAGDDTDVDRGGDPTLRGLVKLFGATAACAPPPPIVQHPFVSPRTLTGALILAASGLLFLPSGNADPAAAAAAAAAAAGATGQTTAPPPPSRAAARAHHVPLELAKFLAVGDVRDGRAVTGGKPGKYMVVRTRAERGADGNAWVRIDEQPAPAPSRKRRGVTVDTARSGVTTDTNDTADTARSGIDGRGGWDDIDDIDVHMDDTNAPRFASSAASVPSAAAASSFASPTDFHGVSVDPLGRLALEDVSLGAAACGDASSSSSSSSSASAASASAPSAAADKAPVDFTEASRWWKKQASARGSLREDLRVETQAYFKGAYDAADVRAAAIRTYFGSACVIYDKPSDAAAIPITVAGDGAAWVIDVLPTSVEAKSVQALLKDVAGAATYAKRDALARKELSGFDRLVRGTPHHPSTSLPVFDAHAAALGAYGKLRKKAAERGGGGLGRGPLSSTVAAAKAAAIKAAAESARPPPLPRRTLTDADFACHGGCAFDPAFDVLAGPPTEAAAARLTGLAAARAARSLCADVDMPRGSMVHRGGTSAVEWSLPAPDPAAAAAAAARLSQWSAEWRRSPVGAAASVVPPVPAPPAPAAALASAAVADVQALPAAADGVQLAAAAARIVDMRADTAPLRAAPRRPWTGAYPLPTAPPPLAVPPPTAPPRAPPLGTHLVLTLAPPPPPPPPPQQQQVRRLVLTVGEDVGGAPRPPPATQQSLQILASLVAARVAREREEQQRREDESARKEAEEQQAQWRTVMSWLQ